MDQHVSTDQLCIGIYVYIDLHWTKHPFLRQAFKIKNAEELKTIRGLGLGSIHFNPEKSDTKPLESKPQVSNPVVDESDAATIPEEKNADPQWQEKAAKIEQQKKRRKRAKACEQALILDLKEEYLSMGSAGYYFDS